jgi:hypothetical protein
LIFFFFFFFFFPVINVNITETSSIGVHGYIMVTVKPNDFWIALMQELVGKMVVNSVFGEKVVGVKAVRCGGRLVKEYALMPDDIEKYPILATCELCMLIFGVFYI